MIVELSNGKTYLVKWEHRTPELSDDEFPDHGGTSCFLFELNGSGEKELVHRVDLQCYYKDCFSKETGRKISMTKVLEYEPNPFRGQFFDKEERTIFWKTYFDRKNKTTKT